MTCYLHALTIYITLDHIYFVQQEKTKILEDLNEREERLRKEREAKDALAAKIKAMEGKLLSGGGNIVDHTNEQQRALEQRRHELAEQKVNHWFLRRLLTYKLSQMPQFSESVFVRPHQ